MNDQVFNTYVPMNMIYLFILFKLGAVASIYLISFNSSINILSNMCSIQ